MSKLVRANTLKRGDWVRLQGRGRKVADVTQYTDCTAIRFANGDSIRLSNNYDILLIEKD